MLLPPSRSSLLVRTAAIVSVALGLVGSVARAQAPSASESSAVAIPAPTIPAPLSTQLAAPDPASTKELDELLAKLASDDETLRKAAIGELADLDATALGAIDQKLSVLRKSADRDGMAKILASVQKRKSTADEGRSGDKAANGKAGRDRGGADAGAKDGGTVDGAARQATHKSATAKERDDDDEKGSPLAPGDRKLIDPAGGDWLASVLAARTDHDKPAYKDLIAILAMERVCVCIGTTAAAREIINVYTYFGDLLLADVGRQLARMSERSLPALIEAKYHDSRMVRTWAERRLDALGKVIPSEAVRTNDNQVLADILRAYGRAREVEAVRVIVTYANSDRIQVREAAREAIGQIGEPARWQLRDAYENLTGKKADTGWDWKRIAMELFASYDRARLSEVYKMADEGFAAYKQGNLDDAIAKFDKVLARVPTFERRAEMAAAYLEHARKLHSTDRLAALAALRRAEVLDPNGPQARSVQSELALLEAEELSARGIVDVTLLRRALELDPANDRARAALETAEHDAETRQASWRRFAAAVAIGVVALAAMVFVALGWRRKKPSAPNKPAGGDTSSNPAG